MIIFMVTGFGSWKIAKFRECRSFFRAKMGPKWMTNTRSSKSKPRPFKRLEQVFLARFELVVTHIGPWKIPECLEHGPFWDQRWVKTG